MTGEELKPDAVIAERYRLVRALGEGGMGLVWEAEHVFTKRRVALKFLKGNKEEDRRRFQREVRAAAAVRHKSVVEVHDCIELPSGMLVMVMDLLDGETLGTVLERVGHLDVPELAAILLPVVSALEATHAVGIVHRDLKPHNIFLAKNDSSVEVRVLDFGIAKLTAAEGLAARTQALTASGSMMGTPYYMSPEQVLSEKDLDGRADIWSLGVVMYEALTGVRPTEADSVGRVLKRILVADFDPIGKHRADLPQDVVGLVGRMLTGDREKRTQTLREVREVIERHAAKEISIPTASRVRGGPHSIALATTAAARSAGDTRHALSIAAKTSRARNRYALLLGGVGAALALVLGIRLRGSSAIAPSSSSNEAVGSSSRDATTHVSIASSPGPSSPDATDASAPIATPSPEAAPTPIASAPARATSDATTKRVPPRASETPSARRAPALATSSTATSNVWDDR